MNRRTLTSRLTSLCLMGLLASLSRAQLDSSAQALNTLTATYKDNIVVERVTTIHEAPAATRIAKPKYSCAIFVANRAAKIDDKKVLVMQDFLTAHVTDDGFSIIAREDVINAVDKLADAGPNKGDKALPGAKLDETLSNNTSALHLAQNLGADYVLMVTISSYGTDTQRYHDAAAGINLVGRKHQLKATYRLLDATVGGSMTAGIATAIITDRSDPNTGGIERENLVDDLLDGASMDLAAMLVSAARGDRIDAPAKDHGDITFEVSCGMADLVIPEIIKDDKGEYTVAAGRYKLEPLAVTVELDGVVIGSTNDRVLIGKPGLHKMRLHREGCVPWERTVNLRERQVLQVSLQMDEQGLRRFKEMTAFLDNLKRERRLTDAEAKAWEQFGKSYKVHIVNDDRVNRMNVNVDTPNNNPTPVPVPPKN